MMKCALALPQGSQEEEHERHRSQEHHSEHGSDG
jgi:hypothetical protein